MGALLHCSPCPSWVGAEGDGQHPTPGCTACPTALGTRWWWGEGVGSSVVALRAKWLCRGLSCPAGALTHAVLSSTLCSLHHCSQLSWELLFAFL